jgi:hypothetical protein
MNHVKIKFGAMFNIQNQYFRMEITVQDDDSLMQILTKSFMRSDEAAATQRISGPLEIRLVGHTPYLVS